MVNIFEDDSVQLHFDEDTFAFTIHQEGREPFDFQELSDGYAAVLDIVVDLLVRMEKHLNGGITFDMPGIVLIDEIETHLHLELQKKVMGFLISVFPNIQFMTFLVVTLLWVVFRAESVEQSLLVLKLMFTAHQGACQPYAWTFFAAACLVIGSIAAYRRAKRTKSAAVNGFYPRLHLTRFTHLVVFFTFLGLTLIMGYFGNTVFIYGQF